MSNCFRAMKLVITFKPEDNAVVPFSYKLEYRDSKPMGWQREYYANGNVKNEKLLFQNVKL